MQVAWRFRAIISLRFFGVDEKEFESLRARHKIKPLAILPISADAPG